MNGHVTSQSALRQLTSCRAGWPAVRITCTSPDEVAETPLPGFSTTVGRGALPLNRAR